MDAYRILYSGGEDEIEIKKSRFIAGSRPVHSEQEAASFLAEVRRRYWDAGHHCSAFTVGMRHELTRCSDDGEPAQTAGRPILDVLLGEDVHDCCVVVTRYFGGTLLGTGGLVRAYAGAAKAALAAGRMLEKRRGFRMDVTVDYRGVGKIQYLAGQAGVEILASRYENQVNLTLLSPAGLYDRLEREIVEATSGRAGICRGDEVWYGTINKEVILF